LRGCEKTLVFEGYGLQPVRNSLKKGPALAAEGHISIPSPTFFRNLLSRLLLQQAAYVPIPLVLTHASRSNPPRDEKK
jgi:hypothetical protein